MKKNLTLLSIGLLTGSIVFGQNISKNIPFQHAKKQSIAHKGLTTNLNQEKVEGDIIWEDDFSDEANWVTANTSTPTHGWRIETDADLSPRAELRPLATPTVDNGFAFVNSDEAGTETNPSSTNADITNATPIDLTLHDNVTLEFYNVTRNFASEYRVYVSGNNGADWTEYVVNQNITTNVNTENPELVKVNISAAAANQDEVLIRFNFIAEWGWFWAIDDVKIVESPGNDIAMTQLLATTGVQGFQYTKLPTTQIPSTKMSFGSKVRNDGSLSQDLTMTVSSSAGADISSPVYTIASQTSDSLAIEEPNGFTIPSTLGVYDFTATIDNDAVANGEVYLLDDESIVGGTGYADATGVAVTGGSGTGLTVDITTDGSGVVTVVSINTPGSGYVAGETVTIDGGDGNATIDIWSIGELVNTEDDALTHPFEVTTKVMAVDSWDGTPVAFSGAFTGWVGDAADPGIGADYEVFQDAMLERVQVGVFPVADESPYLGNGLFVQLYQYDFDQETYVFRAISMTHEIVSADFGTLVNVQFEEPISLQAGDIILPIASFFTGAEVPIGFSGTTIAGSVVGIGDGGIIGLAAEGDLVDAPMVRLDFGTYLNVEESSLVATDVNLYPNPASNNATIAFSLANESAVSVEVRDLAGKLVYSANEGQLAAGSHSLNLSTATMAEGMYTYTLTANDTQVTKKFIVKK